MILVYSRPIKYYMDKPFVKLHLPHALYFNGNYLLRSKGIGLYPTSRGYFYVTNNITILTDGSYHISEYPDKTRKYTNLLEELYYLNNDCEPDRIPVYAYENRWTKLKHIFLSYLKVIL